MLTTSYIAVTHKAQPEYDLLQGEVERTQDEIEHHHTHHYDDTQTDLYSNYSEYGITDWTLWHRQYPTVCTVLYLKDSKRGAIDSRVDEKLDSIPYAIRISKTGKTDGTYLFGTRIMKTKLDKHNEPQGNNRSLL